MPGAECEEASVNERLFGLKKQLLEAMELEAEVQVAKMNYEQLLRRAELRHGQIEGMLVVIRSEIEHEETFA